MTSSGSSNVQNKTHSGGRNKDAGRPDLLAMTPSRNASINSNTSSPQSHSKNRHRYYESRLKDHINQLKSERASLQQQLAQPSSWTCERYKSNTAYGSFNMRVTL